MENAEENWEDGLEITLDFWIISISLQHEEFVTLRGIEPIAHLIIETYRIKKRLEWELSLDDPLRHMEVSLHRLSIVSPFASKEVMSCLLGIQIDENTERLTKDGIISAIHDCFEDATLFKYIRVMSLPNSSIQLFYFELSGNEDSLFELDKDAEFKVKFLECIEERIQHIVPPLFMHRNEEELFRDLLTLRREISSPLDLPQVMVFYDEHNMEKIVFNVLMVRSIPKHSNLSLSSLNQIMSEAHIQNGQIYEMGELNEGYSIQGDIFQMTLLEISNFQRKNDAIDYYLARREIIYSLTKGLGEVRDFNGGMLVKQGERLSELKTILSEVNSAYSEFIENFFYSIRPIEKQATLSITLLRKFFSIFRELFDDLAGDYSCLADKEVVFFAIRDRDRSVILDLKKYMINAKLQNHRTIFSSWAQGRMYYHGYLLFCSSTEEAQRLGQAISQRFQELKNLKNKKRDILRLANNFVQFELDPRIGGTSESMAVNKLLFEGLTRLENGVPVLAAAKSYVISDDLCSYTFVLRDLYWSNGEPITAGDFEYAWKQILSPNFNTRFAYLFYVILNAERAKKGECSLDEVGIEVINDKTLIIRLSHPVAYFLELLAISLYSPVYRKIDKENPSWSRFKDATFVCNGPFRLKSPRPYYLCEMEPNPYYWNPRRVRLDGISIATISSKASIKQFHQGDLDWVGFPFGAPSLKSMKDCSNAETLDFSKVFWYCFNVNSFPLTNKKIRQAIFYSIDRKGMIQKLGVDWIPTYSPLPIEHSSFNSSHYKTIENKDFSCKLFLEGCNELGVSPKDFPTLKLIYLEIELFSNAAKAFKQRIQEVLGIACEIEGVSFLELFERMSKGDYQIGVLRWSSWVDDPLYTLSTFQNRQEKINLPKWENDNFKKLISLAQSEPSKQKREEIIAEAEKVLIDDFVVLPLGVGKDKVFRNPELIIPQKGMLGTIDFSNAYFQKPFEEDKIIFN
ncbi:MAG: peptide ABC transporter substrate-binding protein [Chlamydiales bacterium]|nr:peptide ABC transporter substrate-binding protein [Chlamydiales bacterium]